MTTPSILDRRLDWNSARAFEGCRVEFLRLEETQAISASLEVVAVTARPAQPGGSQFTIRFRGPSEPCLAQRTYRVRHPSLGDYAIFVTPIAQSAVGTDYEACFAHAD